MQGNGQLSRSRDRPVRTTGPAARSSLVASRRGTMRARAFPSPRIGLDDRTSAAQPLHRRTARPDDPPARRRRRRPGRADLVVTGARLLSTYSERILENREIRIAGGRIAAVLRPVLPGPRRFTTPPARLIAPGLVDPHLHIESSMVTACAYAEAALINGTTTIVCDSHEIGTCWTRRAWNGCWRMPAQPRSTSTSPSEHGARDDARDRDRGGAT